MGRQLFLHHYLPSHLASALLTGALLQFLFSQGFDGPVSPGVVIPGSRASRQSVKSPTVETQGHDQTVLRIVGALIVVALFGAFLWFAPFTYGTPGCSVEKLNGMRWLDTWDFHFMK